MDSLSDCVLSIELVVAILQLCIQMLESEEPAETSSWLRLDSYTQALRLWGRGIAYISFVNKRCLYLLNINLYIKLFLRTANKRSAHFPEPTFEQILDFDKSYSQEKNDSLNEICKEKLGYNLGVGRAFDYVGTNYTFSYLVELYKKNNIQYEIKNDSFFHIMGAYGNGIDKRFVVWIMQNDIIIPTLDGLVSLIQKGFPCHDLFLEYVERNLDKMDFFYQMGCSYIYGEALKKDDIRPELYDRLFAHYYHKYIDTDVCSNYDDPAIKNLIFFYENAPQWELENVISYHYEGFINRYGSYRVTRHTNNTTLLLEIVEKSSRKIKPTVYENLKKMKEYYSN